MYLAEESAELKKPLLVMRDVSERPEALETGTALLVGTNRVGIAETALRILSDDVFRKSLLSRGENPFGSGDASEKIADVIAKFFENRQGVA